MIDRKTVLITGAGSGIGATAARLFVSKGWFVGLYDLNSKSVESLSIEFGENTCFGQMDVTDRASVQRAFEDFSTHTGGRLDAMINNAGLFQDKPFMEADANYLQTMMHVNMDGVVNCARAAYPLLKATPDSHLVNLGSAASIYGVPNEAIYSATKFFVRGLTEALRIEWEQDQITVNVVMPSYVATPMTDGVSVSHLKGDKFLTTEEIAEAIYEAATTNGMYWIMPKKARLLQTLLRKIPLRWVPIFARKAFY